MIAIILTYRTTFDLLFVAYCLLLLLNINVLMKNPFTPFYGIVSIHTLKSCLRTMETLSGLSFIQVEDPSNPAPLFQRWLNEAKQNNAQTSLMNLATAAKNGKVSNRTVVIRDISDGCLIFTAQAKSNKIRDIVENPQVAATILLLYFKNNKSVNKQIRVVGTAVELPKEQCRIYYEKEKLSSKIRSWICQNCGPADWDELKSKHDELLKEVVDNRKVLEMPENQVAYKIVPSDIDFYFSSGDEIADRILFKKTETGEWKYERLAA